MDHRGTETQRTNDWRFAPVKPHLCASVVRASSDAGPGEFFRQAGVGPRLAKVPGESIKRSKNETVGAEG